MWSLQMRIICHDNMLFGQCAWAYKYVVSSSSWNFKEPNCVDIWCIDPKEDIWYERDSWTKVLYIGSKLTIYSRLRMMRKFNQRSTIFWIWKSILRVTLLYLVVGYWNLLENSQKGGLVSRIEYWNTQFWVVSSSSA